MQVAAFSTRTSTEWRWRIVNDAGDVLEESRETFSTISLAVTHGKKRQVEMNVVDRSVAASTYRSTSHLRGR
jgi:hypothetical protein